MRKALLIPFVASALLGCAPGTGGDTGTGGNTTTGSGGSPTGSGGQSNSGGMVGSGGQSNSGGMIGSGGMSTGSGGMSTGSGGMSTGSGGMGTGTGGMGTGTGGRGTGGMGTGTGGMGTGTGGMGTGTGGRANTGGMGTGGMGTGTGGMGTGTGGMSGGDPSLVAKPINGVLVTGPCDHDVSNGGSVCDTRKVGAACPDQGNADVPLIGIKTFDKMYTLGGTAGTKYSITIHVQGEVEAKQYTGGMRNMNATTKTSPNTDGWYYPPAGGTAKVVQGTYNVYLFRVKTPGGVQSDYFLNAIQPPGVQNHTTYGMDYTATFVAEGTSTIRIVSSDSNCQMIRNCGPTENDGSRCQNPITPANVEADLKTANPTFAFDKPFDGQWLGITVKSVVQM